MQTINLGNNPSITINLQELNNNTGNYRFTITSNLPNFTVITGLNGSGKSKFLNHLNNVLQEQNRYTSKHNFILHTTINKRDTDTFYHFAYNLGYTSAIRFNDDNSITFSEYVTNYLNTYHKKEAEDIKQILQNFFSNQDDNSYLTEFGVTSFGEDPSSPQYKKDKFLELSVEERKDKLMSLYPFDGFFSKSLNVLLKTDFEKIRCRQTTKNDSTSDFNNYINYLLGENDGEKYTLANFIDFVTETLKTTNLTEDSLLNLFNKNKYLFSFNTNTDKKNTRADELVRLIDLIRKHNRYNNQLEELSDGEKNIFIMFFYLFIWQKDFNENGKKAKSAFKNTVLFLDEPDATLHPSVAKIFIEILDKIYCNKFGIKVIMVSHNLASIASVPEKSLFIMQKKELENKNAEFNLSQANKTDIINIVAQPVVTEIFNIFGSLQQDKFNILVEGTHDKEILERALEILSQNDEALTKLNHNINFIDAGGCEKIKSFLKNLPTNFKDLVNLAILDNDQAGLGVYKELSQTFPTLLLPIPDEDNKEFKKNITDEKNNKLTYYNTLKNKELKDLQVTCIEFLFRDKLIEQIKSLPEEEQRSKFLFYSAELYNLLDIKRKAGTPEISIDDKFLYKMPSSDDTKISDFKNKFVEIIKDLEDKKDFNNVKPLFNDIIKHNNYKEWLERMVRKKRHPVNQ